MTGDFGPRVLGNDDIVEFFDYVLSTYVDDRAKYSPGTGAGCRANAIRTTNICEGFNAQLNGMFYQSHPHVFKLLNALLGIQDFAYIKMKSPAKITVKDDCEMFLEEQFKVFEQEEITHFWDSTRIFAAVSVKL